MRDFGVLSDTFSRIIHKLLRINSKNKNRVKQWPDYEFYNQEIWVLRGNRENIFFLFRTLSSSFMMTP